MAGFGRDTLQFVRENARWLGGGFLLTMFSSFGQTFFIGLSGEDLRAAFGLSSGGFGGLYMLATLASAISLPWLGRTLDLMPGWKVVRFTMPALAMACVLITVAPNVVVLILALYLLRLFGQGMMTETAYTENTAKWLAEHRKLPDLTAERERLCSQLSRPWRGRQASLERVKERLATVGAEIARWQLRPDQMVIVDEASLAGTFALDELVAAATDAPAKVLLVGDWAQLSAVDAGGAFGLIARDRKDMAPELSDVHRFTASWEKAASVELRLGRAVAIDAYRAHGRVVGGPRDDLLDAVYAAWRRHEGGPIESHDRRRRRHGGRPEPAGPGRPSRRRCRRRTRRPGGRRTGRRGRRRGNHPTEQPPPRRWPAMGQER